MNNYGFQLKDIMIQEPTGSISTHNKLFNYDCLGNEYKLDNYGERYSIETLSFQVGRPQDYDFFTTNPLGEYEKMIDRIMRGFYAKYKNYYIAFDRPDAFLTEFILKFNKRLVELHYKTESALKLYKITEDELMTNEKHIIALANNNASVDVDDNANYLNEIQGYVDQQKGSKIKGNKFDAFYKYYTFVENDLLLDFINELKNLFVLVIPNTKYIYNGGF